MKTLPPADISGEITAPGSKSFSQRAIVASLLCREPSTLLGLDSSNDTQAAQRCANDLRSILRGEQQSTSAQINIGESGLSARLFTPIAATLDCEVEISGKGSILKRPMDFMAAPLTALGVKFACCNHLLPITVKGPFTGSNVEIEGSHGSQFISGMLFALARTAKPSLLKVNNLTSRPYVDMTLEVMRAFGVTVQNKDYQEFTIAGGQQFTACKYQIEGDWSGASCLLVAGAVNGKIAIKNLNKTSSQADKEIITALQRAGAKVEWDGDTVSVAKPQNGLLQSFEFDATDCPDLFPALAVLAASCQGVTTLRGANRLTHKESNRALALKTEFAKAAVTIDLTQDDVMRITGTDKIKGGVTYDSWGDHRIAMATAVLALRGDKESMLTGHQSVNKSYPEFWDDFNKIIKIK